MLLFLTTICCYFLYICWGYKILLSFASLCLNAEELFIIVAFLSFLGLLHCCLRRKRCELPFRVRYPAPPILISSCTPSSPIRCGCSVDRRLLLFHGRAPFPSPKTGRNIAATDIVLGRIVLPSVDFGSPSAEIRRLLFGKDPSLKLLVQCCLLVCAILALCFSAFAFLVT